MKGPLIVACAFLVLAASAARAQTLVVQRYTVIPVVMVDGLSSAKNKVGDKFEAACSSSNRGGFPERTKFVGVVTQVSRKTKSAAGSIDVKFTEAVLPDGVTLPINGTLIALSEDNVKIDPVTGNLVGTETVRREIGKFMVLGAGVGLMVSGSGKKTRGALRGAVIGTLIGAGAKPKVSADDVVVPIGTEIGILLRDPVEMKPAAPPSPPKVTTTPDGTTVLTFTEATPYEEELALMIPLRPVMDALGKSFSYDSAKKEVSVQSDAGMIRHVVLTDEIRLGKVTLGLEASSDFRNGILYVPKEMLELGLGRTIQWDAGAKEMTLK